MNIVSVIVQREILLCKVGMTGYGFAGNRIWSTGPNIVPALDGLEEILNEITLGGVGKLALTFDVVSPKELEKRLHVGL